MTDSDIERMSIPTRTTIVRVRLPFSIMWRDDLKNDAIRIPCSTLLIALGSTASGCHHR